MYGPSRECTALDDRECTALVGNVRPDNMECTALVGNVAGPIIWNVRPGNRVRPVIGYGPIIGNVRP